MRKTPIHPGQIHHIYNRGVNHKNIFFTRDNWAFFLRRLRQYILSQEDQIIAYCLMPNHFHLLVKVHSDDFGKQVMQPLSVSYTKAINKQENRAGPLFQGPFQNRLVPSDGDLIHLSRYLHLNPVTAGLIQRPEEWHYSSYPEYTGLRNGTLPSPEAILDHFPSAAAYAAFVNDPPPSHEKIPPELLLD